MRERWREGGREGKETEVLLSGGELRGEVRGRKRGKGERKGGIERERENA